MVGTERAGLNLTQPLMVYSQLSPGVLVVSDHFNVKIWSETTQQPPLGYNSLPQLKVEF